MQKLLANRTFTYFAKAIILVGILMLVAMVAPHLPAPILPLFIVAYALVATMGALYHTVIHRLHKQKKLTADGTLAHYNRRWVLWLIGYLVAFSFSGFFFLLDAPTWEPLEWAFTWAAITVYYVVYLGVRYRLKREYGPAYYKAQSMLWSFWITAAILCLLYAALSMVIGNHIEYTTMRAAFDGAPQPYQDSPSALMGEVGYASSFTSGLTNYFVAQAETSWYAFGFVFQFAFYALALFGLVNQFGFCLLDARELKSEFQLLPADDDESGGQSQGKTQYLLRYFLIVGAVAVVVFANFLFLEVKVSAVRSSEEATWLKACVEEQKDWLIERIDGVAQVKEASQKADDIINQANAVLQPAVNAYYEDCANNLDAYLDWYYSPFGMVAKLFKNTDEAVKVFKEKVTSGVSDADILAECQRSEARLDELAQNDGSLNELAMVPANLLAAKAGFATIQQEGLWNLDDHQKAIILGQQNDPDRETMKAQLAELINAVREHTLTTLDPSRNQAP